MTKSSRNFKELIEIARCELPDNYQKHINPPFEKFLKVTGFDRTYIRGCGAFLYDENGNEFIDCVAGHAVHSLGRSHPDIVAAL
ncbi:MAG: aspartate aminotransferase family protein, partial [Planctomycetota bacterium]|nr:aspartate aminotransferase family protein [Planctomycetota bacterium]